MKAIRLFRVLRPLRIISKNEGLKLAVSALLLAIPHILNVIVISVLFFIIFGIIGVNYLKGSFFYCFMGSTYPLSLSNAPVVTVFDCLNYGGVWLNQDQTFDNIVEAILTLYQISTTEGWSELMYQAIDATGIGTNPVSYSQPAWAVFFSFFIVVGNFFMLNLFVGVVVSTFKREKEALGKNFLLTSNQKRWIHQKKIVINATPKRLEAEQVHSKARSFCKRLISSQHFEVFVGVVIMLNTVALCITWYNQDAASASVVSLVNYVFAGFFVLEMLAKLFGLGLRAYFADGWNTFDFFVVVGTFISVVVTILTPATIGPVTTFVRAFRITRVIRLVKRARRLKVIFETFIVTIPALANVGGLLLLFLYIYAILGVFLFADVKLQTNLSVHANFQTFGVAFLTLLRCATGESWDYVMLDAARQESPAWQCDPAPFDYATYLQNGGKLSLFSSQRLHTTAGTAWRCFSSAAITC